MMIAMAVVAVLCCVFLTLPGWVGALFLFIATIILMPATLAALIYGTGRTRAFAIGASPPMCIVFLLCTGVGGRGFPFFDFGDDIETRISSIVVICVVVASGFVAQGVRWWCLRQAN